MDGQRHNLNFSLSMDVYSALCETFGIAEVIALKRVSFETTPENDITISLENLQRMEISSIFPNLQSRIVPLLSQRGKPSYRMVPILSGSRAEGVSLKSSDVDVMYIYPTVKAVESLAQANEGVDASVYLIEKEYTRPGFIRLKAPSCRTKFRIFEIQHNNAVYMSSKLFKEWILKLFNRYVHDNDSLQIHGPCIELTSTQGPMDNAVVVSSEKWPLDAFGCLHRLCRKHWPSHEVITEMVKDGCLFVPIGMKDSPFEDLEWRVSFSRAEKRLVYSMNQTQLLTYALLKLLLKERIEQITELDGLLCSYFMKTAVFWEIVEGGIKWIPPNFLQCFWACIRRLIRWITGKYCPNFFIPENNMFFGKTKDPKWTTLMHHMTDLYKKGYSTINSIPTLRNIIVGVQSPMLKQLTRTDVFVSVHRQLVLIFEENPIKVCKFLRTQHADFLPEIRQFLEMTFLNKYFFGILMKQCNNRRNNKTQYSNEGILRRVLRHSSTDCLQGKLCFAIYLYKRKRYTGSINLLQQVRSELDNENNICLWRFDPHRYASLGGNTLSILDGLRKNTISYMPLQSKTCLDEMSDMIKSLEDSPQDIQFVPPYVITLFTLCLCHFWNGERGKSCEILIDLQRTLVNGNGHHVNRSKLPIAWHILGIAQEIVGDFESAKLSFSETRKFLRAAQLDELENFKKLNKTKIQRMKSILSPSGERY